MVPVKLRYTNLTTLPNSFFTEQAVINILLNNPFLLKKTILQLKTESFYFEPHKIIYEILAELCKKERVINLTTLISTLQDKQLLKKVGGIERLIQIINQLENVLSLDDYIQILNEKYLRRLIIEFGKQIIGWGYLTSMNLNEILEKIETAIFNLNQQKMSEKMYTAAEIIDDIFLEMKEKVNKNQIDNYKTNFYDLDLILQGFQKSDLIIVAGRPSMGKTAFSLNIGKNIIEKYNIPLLIFSLEMSRQQILYRFISTNSKIHLSRLKSGKMTISEWQTLSNSLKYISELPIFIDDNPNINLLDIQSKIRNTYSKNKKNGIVIIDYLQLMKLNLKLENRVQEISHITRSLKIMAKEFQTPIIVLSQLSRSLESRVNKRPMLSDLRESGCVKNLKLYEKISTWGNNKIHETTLSSLEFKGKKPTYLLLFENNIEISLTSNHRILSQNGWIKLSQINKNTFFYFFNLKENKKDLLKVKEVKYEGLNNVYEKTVPFYHNYIHQNLVMHNSIEQDADIVIMLYRDDYYNNKKNNKQITEVIVAKHRNGNVGTARLLFNPYLTKFNNLKSI